MPPIFKTLASITAWIQWIAGLVMGFSLFIMGLIKGVLYGPEPVPMSMWAGFAVALAYGIGAVVVMKLRKTLE